jgi:hypothetical protein
MDRPLCRLCKVIPAISGSHITPAFIYRAIKANSVTGFMRRAMSPNQRRQDGDKHPILCRHCEERFGRRESEFNNQVFKAFHISDRDVFNYGDWLHYFLTSIAWRTLIMELATPTTVNRMPPTILKEFHSAAETMRLYLLGDPSLADSICNHLFLFSGEASYSRELAAAGPNFIIRRSAGGYAVWTRSGYSAVFHNLAGVLCVTPIGHNPRDTWENTRIDPKGGRFEPPQKVSSWVAEVFFEDVIEFSKNRTRMSDKQRAIVQDSALRNPEASARRFWEADQRLIRGLQPGDTDVG